MKMELFKKKKLMWGIGKHFRRYAQALRFANSLHSARRASMSQYFDNLIWDTFL